MVTFNGPFFIVLIIIIFLVVIRWIEWYLFQNGRTMDPDEIQYLIGDPYYKKLLLD
mgnify:CR=1 FL=1